MLLTRLTQLNTCSREWGRKTNCFCFDERSGSPISVGVALLGEPASQMWKQWSNEWIRGRKINPSLEEDPSFLPAEFVEVATYQFQCHSAVTYHSNHKNLLFFFDKVVHDPCIDNFGFCASQIETYVMRLLFHKRIMRFSMMNTEWISKCYISTWN